MSVRKRFRCGQCNMELASPEQACPKCGPVGLVQIATADEAVIVADDFAAGILGNTRWRIVFADVALPPRPKLLRYQEKPSCLPADP